MVKYYAVVENNYVFCVSEYQFGDRISEDMYTKISNAIKNKPTPPNGFAYRLKADTLEWELVEVPPVPEPGGDEPTAEDKAEAYDILMGVTE